METGSPGHPTFTQHFGFQVCANIRADGHTAFREEFGAFCRRRTAVGAAPFVRIAGGRRKIWSRVRFGAVAISPAAVPELTDDLPGDPVSPESVTKSQLSPIRASQHLGMVDAESVHDLTES